LRVAGRVQVALALAMRSGRETIHLTASDLVGHLNCRYLTALDLAVARGEAAKPSVWDPVLEILVERGARHEKAYIDHLKSQGHAVSVIDGVGATDDAPVPRRVMLRVFERAQGICPKCTRKLHPDHWDCDHIIAIINGGENRESNLQPLCNTPCHSKKTKDDVRIKSRSASIRKNRTGLRKPRTITRWRKFNGDVVIA